MIIHKNDSFWGWFWTRMIHLGMFFHKNDSFEYDSSQEWFVWGWFFTRMIHLRMVLDKNDLLGDDSLQRWFICGQFFTRATQMFTSSQGGFVCGRFFARMIHIWTSLHTDISFVEHFSQGRFGGLVLCGPATSPLVTGKFFFEFLMKVLTEVHCGILLGNPKFQVNTFIHYQDMEILKFSVFQQCNFIFQPIVFKFQIYSG